MNIPSLELPRFRSPFFGATALVVGSWLAACSDDSSSGGGTGGSSVTGGSSSETGGSQSGGNAGKSGSATGGASSAGNGSGGSATGGTAAGGASGSAGASTQGGSAGEAGAVGEGGVGGVSEGGTAGESAGGDGGGPLDDTPILERTPRLTYDCSESTPLTPLEINPWYGGDLANAEAGILFLRAESTELGNTGDLVLSTLDAAGELGSPTPLDSIAEGYFDLPRLAAGADGFGAVWWVSDFVAESHASFAELDAQGVVRTEAVPLEGFATLPNGLDIASAGDGYAILWAEYNEDFTAFTLQLGLLDATGGFAGEPTPLRQGATNMTATGLTAFDDGLVAAYVEQGEEPQTFLLFLDADGTPRGEPVPLGRSSFAGGISFLEHGDELFVAHTVATGGQFEMAATAVSIARFDATGTPSGPDVLVQTPVLDLDNVDGQLVAYGDDIGLVWSQGTIIYICAGCMPDNHLRFVVLDGYDLTPLSEVVVLPNEQLQGGFIRPRMANAGDEFVITSTLMYHVSGEGASAGIACSAVE